MPSYSKVAAEAVTFRRCVRVEISNPLGGTAVIQFYEEDVYVVDGVTVSRPVTPISVSVVPTTPIDVYDPSTGQPTGASITHSDVYAYLYSAYMASALARDNLSSP